MTATVPHLELDVAEALLDRLAAETGATYACFARYAGGGAGRVFYGVSFHHGSEVKADHGNTLSEALIAALAKEPFQTGHVEEEACSCAYGAQGAPVDADCAVHGLPTEAEAA